MGQSSFTNTIQPFTAQRYTKDRDVFRMPKLSIYLLIVTGVAIVYLIYELRRPNGTLLGLLGGSALLISYLGLFFRSRSQRTRGVIEATILLHVVSLGITLISFPENYPWVITMWVSPLVLSNLFVSQRWTTLLSVFSVLFLFGIALQASQDGVGDYWIYFFAFLVTCSAVFLSGWYMSMYEEHRLRGLAAEERRSRQLLMGAYHGILSVENGMIRSISGTIERRLGYEPNGILNQSFAQIFPKLGSVDETQSVSRGTVVKPDGREISLEYVVVNDPDMDRDGYLVALRDVSELVAANTALEKARRLEGIGLMAGGVAHDFNNLLMAIKGQATIATLKLPIDAPSRNNLVKLMMSVDRGADLTRQLLAYAGKGNYETTTFDFNEFASDILKLLRSNLPASIRMQTQLATVPLLVHADRGQLQQIIFNLVINASQAIGDEQGWIKVCSQAFSAEEIAKQRPVMHDGSSLRQQDHLLFTVEDDGCGMSQATIERIFEPFFTTKSTGTGLGLAATIGALQAHEGNLQLSSRVGQGTRFSIWLPLSHESAQALPRTTNVTPEAIGGKTILVVDDEAEVRESVIEMLKLSNFEVLSAENGRKGLEVYIANRDNIDLVLLDMQMPIMGGEATYYHLSAIDPEVPIVMISGYTDPSSVSRLMSKDELAFLPKPFDYTDLIRTVNRALLAKSVFQLV